jgi:hypothetical protein
MKLPADIDQGPDISGLRAVLVPWRQQSGPIKVFTHFSELHREVIRRGATRMPVPSCRRHKDRVQP